MNAAFQTQRPVWPATDPHTGSRLRALPPLPNPFGPSALAATDRTGLQRPLRHFIQPPRRFRRPDLRRAAIDTGEWPVLVIEPRAGERTGRPLPARVGPDAPGLLVPQLRLAHLLSPVEDGQERLFRV